MIDNFAGRNVLVMGLGVNDGGVGVARYLVDQGAQVRVTDMQNEDRLEAPLSALAELPIQYTLGRHERTDFEWAEIVVRNPAVPRESTWLALARELGAQIEMEMTLFFRACRAPIVGITGTKGKTTTTTMLGTLLQQRWPAARIAGNMGRSAVLELENLQHDVPVAIELSSFQIEGLAEQRLAPRVSVFTNIDKDHLDRYRSFDDYAATKASLALIQSAEDWCIFHRDDPELTHRLAGTPARVVTFGEGSDDCERSFWIERERFVGRWGEQSLDFGDVSLMRLPGRHQRLNALAAIAAATAVGVPAENIRAGIAEFSVVAGRMETIRVVDGVEFVNDTTATAPLAAIAALESYRGRPVVLITGGSDKGIDFGDLLRHIAGNVSSVVLLSGTVTERIQPTLESVVPGCVFGPFDTMAAAVKQASDVAEQGGVVLLSPGFASFGMFQNEFDRGRRFRRAVEDLERERSESSS